MEGTDLLLIDDDADLAALLQDYLGRHGYAVRWADRPSKGREELSRQAPRLLLLDVMLPEQDGFSFCRELRAGGSDLPVIMLTAKGDDQDKIAGLQLGADDYVPKPFNPQELLARIQAVLRRYTPPEQPAGRFLLDEDRRIFSIDGRTIQLTPHEFRLLEKLLQKPGRLFTRAQLLEALDDTGFSEAYDRSIDLHVSRIRQKLEDDPRHPRYLVTVWGQGYRFQC